LTLVLRPPQQLTGDPLVCSRSSDEDKRGDSIVPVGVGAAGVVGVAVAPPGVNVGVGERTITEVGDSVAVGVRERVGVGVMACTSCTRK
jgi:hypothetical protein